MPSGQARLIGVAEGVLAVVGAAGVWLAASRLPDSLVQGQPAPGAWPRALALGLGVLGAVLVVNALRDQATGDETLEPVNPAQWPVLAGTLVLLAGFLVAWPWAGYLPTALVSFPLLSRLVGVGSWARSAGWGVGLALFTWSLFSQALGMPL